MGDMMSYIIHGCRDVYKEYYKDYDGVARQSARFHDSKNSEFAGITTTNLYIGFYIFILHPSGRRFESCIAHHSITYRPTTFRSRLLACFVLVLK